MSNLNQKMSKSIYKFRNLKRIDSKKKNSLINLVYISCTNVLSILQESFSTRQAAQKLQIKYSTAKYIVKNFKNKGQNFDQHKQNHSKQKSRVSNVSIIIDVSDGNITIVSNSKKLSYYDLNTIQDELKNDNLLQTSEFIFQKLGKILWNKINYKYCLDPELLKAQLLKQHHQMKNL